MLQTALVAGAVRLTIANVLQLRLEPVTDAAEGADVATLAAGGTPVSLNEALSGIDHRSTSLVIKAILRATGQASR